MAKFFYIMGASGSGKDSVMRFAREHLEQADHCVFAHRYITRPAEAGGENHVALSEREFDSRLRQGLFCLHWESHGLKYGVGIEAREWLAAGLNVVVNGSRAYLATARERFPELEPVLIEVSRETLRQRLESRGRESAEAIERRLARAEAVEAKHERLTRIGNDGPLDVAGGRLLSLLSGLGKVQPVGLAR